MILIIANQYEGLGGEMEPTSEVFGALNINIIRSAAALKRKLQGKSNTTVILASVGLDRVEDPAIDVKYDDWDKMIFLGYSPLTIREPKKQTLLPDWSFPGKSNIYDEIGVFDEVHTLGHGAQDGSMEINIESYRMFFDKNKDRHGETHSGWVTTNSNASRSYDEIKATEFANIYLRPLFRIPSLGVGKLYVHHCWSALGVAPQFASALHNIPVWVTGYTGQVDFTINDTLGVYLPPTPSEGSSIVRFMNYNTE